MSYTIAEIAQVLHAAVQGEEAGSVSYLLTDSRSLCFPRETLFFALRTQRGDGHRYIAELYRRGVRSFVVDHCIEATDAPEAVFLQVENTLDALQQLAGWHRSHFTGPVIGITGSNGKTTVKEWLYQLLAPDHNVCRSPRSYNSQVGVPLSLWLIDRHTDLALIEAGISQPGEMARLEAIIRPTIGVLTNIGSAHQEHFTSLGEKRTEKEILLKHCTRRITPEALPFRLISKQKTVETSMVTISLDGQEYTYTLPFADDASIDNSLTCMAVCLTLGMAPSVICQRMSALEPVAMRMEVKDGINGCTLINDTYNSDIHSLSIALDFMARRQPEAARKFANTRQAGCCLILSDILQSGMAPRELYSLVAEMAEERGITQLIGVGPDLCAHADLFPMETRCFESTDALLASPLLSQLHDQLILLKGARPFCFERIAERLTLKVHQTILEVDLNALVANLNHYRSLTAPGTKMVCMVKASAYGMGAVEVSKTLQEHGVDYLAVAVADEGAELRRAGITTPIMVMNPETCSTRMLFDYHLEPEVFSFDILEALIRAGEREGITHWPVHIKLDTGMHRLGFDPTTDMDALIRRLQRQRALTPASVFSHFVGSDSDGFDAFSQQQFTLFTQAADQLQAAYDHHILRHICNSAAIEHFPRYQLDMVRLGLGLYGINPRDNSLIHNVSTLRTTILQVRDVPAGDSVGYSRKSFVDRPTRIAAIPIGYADGLARALGNRRGYCLVNGCKAPYVGNICMDVSMIDVTDIPCQAGDQAVIFGADLPVSRLSDAIGTIPYEVLTAVAGRVQHIYVQE